LKLPVGEEHEPGGLGMIAMLGPEPAAQNLLIVLLMIEIQVVWPGEVVVKDNGMPELVGTYLDLSD
jgi:hypothetical protein